MKRLFISAGILVALFIVLLGNIHYLKNFVGLLSAELELAASFAQTENWQRAEEITHAVSDTWEEKKTYLQITLRHEQIDEIYVLIEECLAYLQERKIGEYRASNKALITKLKMLYEMEEFTMKNIL